MAHLWGKLLISPQGFSFESYLNSYTLAEYALGFFFLPYQSIFPSPVLYNPSSSSE
jgi:hypothetical protein